MLVLSRYKDETIVIGSGAEQIRIMVLDIRGDKIRIGIECPKEIPVHRLEVFEAIQRQNKLANKTTKKDG